MNSKNRDQKSCLSARSIFVLLCRVGINDKGGKENELKLYFTINENIIGASKM